jgi:LmbE family N-acetylglucosaminyl deacetylase
MNSLVVLSPHRDDAVFSIGMWLRYWSLRNVRITIANFFTSSAYAPRAVVSSDSGETNVAAVSALRQREDRRALAQIAKAIRVRSFGMLDAPLRFSIPASAVSDVAAVSVRQADVHAVRSRIRQLGNCGILFVGPLGLGTHVDHLTVWCAATIGIRPHALAFYEDLPYAAWTAEEAILDRVRMSEDRLRSHLRPRILRTEHHVRCKQGLAAAYRTQISRAEGLAIADYGTKYKSGERIWIPLHTECWNAFTRVRH